MLAPKLIQRFTDIMRRALQFDLSSPSGELCQITGNLKGRHVVSRSS
jgi:ribosomal protein L32